MYEIYAHTDGRAGRDIPLVESQPLFRGHAGETVRYTSRNSKVFFDACGEIWQLLQFLPSRYAIRIWHCLRQFLTESRELRGIVEEMKMERRQ